MTMKIGSLKGVRAAEHFYPSGPSQNRSYGRLEALGVLEVIERLGIIEVLVPPPTHGGDIPLSDLVVFLPKRSRGIQEF